MDRIKQFLLSQNISEKDIDEAISRLNQTQPQSQSSNTQIETQLRNYIQSQLNNGYGIEIIKNALLKQGFSSDIITKALNNSSDVNINVKHEVNVSKGTIVWIVLIILIIGFGAYAAINLNVFSPKQSLLDMTISTTSYSYLPGETVNYQIHMTNMGTVQRFDATIKYLIVDDSGSIITRKEETLAVETTASVNRNIQLPQNIMPGKYYLQAIATYGNKEAKTSSEIEVVQKTSDKKPDTYRPVVVPSIGTGTNPAPGINTPTNTPDITSGSNPTISTSGNTQSFGESMASIRELAKTNAESASSTCTKFSSQNQEDLCYSIIADTSKISSYCSKIILVNNKDNCYLAFAMGGQSDVCDNIQDGNSKAFCDQLNLVQQMNKYYKENNTEKILELSKQYNPNIYTNSPPIPNYEYAYNEASTLIIDASQNNVTPVVIENVSVDNSSLNLSSDNSSVDNSTLVNP